MRDREYGLAVAVDFGMDLMAGSFDRDSLRRLFSLYRGWGVNRIDWGYTGPHAAGYYSRFNAYQGTHENAYKTHKALGEFVPAVARIAHELGMTCHVIFNPFDRGFNVPYFRPRNAAEARDGIQGEIGGGVRRAWKSYLGEGHLTRVARRRQTPLRRGQSPRPASRRRRLVLHQLQRPGRTRRLARAVPEDLARLRGGRPRRHGPLRKRSTHPQARTDLPPAPSRTARPPGRPAAGGMKFWGRLMQFG